MRSLATNKSAIQEIIASGRNTIDVEAEALKILAKRIDKRFVRAVELLYNCTGKVILTGIGKSGIISRKIAATLASTGTPALFLHPTEGLHGDLGVVTKEDLVIAISNSGSTEELIKIIPSLKRQGLILIAFTSRPDTELAKASDLWLDISIPQEACPLGLAPTASTTVSLALGDALAMALLAQRGFKVEDFALRHPGGALGRKLLLRVCDLMLTDNAIPLVGSQATLREALKEMTNKGLGITGIISPHGCLIGVLTDGDLRRLMTCFSNPLTQPITDLMTCSPKTISADSLASEALQEMERNQITALFVTTPETHPCGIIHLHHLLRAGIA